LANFIFIYFLAKFDKVSTDKPRTADQTIQR